MKTASELGLGPGLHSSRASTEERSSLERMKTRARLKSRLSTLLSLTSDYRQWSLLQTREKRAGTEGLKQKQHVGGPSSTDTLMATI